MTLRKLCSLSLNVLFLALAFLMVPAWLWAQQVSGLTGVVTDSSGAVAPRVSVKLVNTATGAEYTTTTNDVGAFLFVKLPPGTSYTVTFSKENFRTLTITNVALGVGRTETINVQMEVGAISQTIEVTAATGATLNTTDASIGNVLDPKRLRDLPTLVRNSPAALMGLQPGVVANMCQGSTSVAGCTNREGAVTGARTDQGNITIDGIDANDVTTGQAFATTGNAPIDAIQEFRTVSAIPNAGEGRSSGGQIELVTKSGTNDFHGSAREYHRNTVTAANNWFNNRSGIPTPALIRNQFGASLGGPVRKDKKLFFFFDYEGRRDASGVAYLRTVPLDHFRNGSVAYINTSSAACSSQSRLNTTPNCITILTPAQVASIDPKGVGADAALQSFVNSRYPHANDLTAGDGVNTGGFRFNAPSHRADNTYTARLDWTPTSSQKIFLRGNIARRLQTDTVNTVAAQFPGDPESGQIKVMDYAYVLGHTWTISSNKINQLTLGVSRSGLNFPRPFKPTVPNSWTFASTAVLSAPFAGFSEQDRFVPVPTIRDDFTYLKGRHNYQFGGNIRPIQQKSGLTNDFNFITVGIGGLNRSLNASLRPANILNTTTSQGLWDSLFTFSLGRFASQSTNFNYNTSGQAFPLDSGKRRNFHYNEFEFYWQDSWRATSSLTLTYGVRWQYYSIPFEANGFQSVSDIGLNTLFAIRQANATAGVGGFTAEPLLHYDLGGKANSARDYFSPDLHNWAPRFNLAYNPAYRNGLLGRVFGDRKTVVRLGGAVLYDRVGGAITFIQDQVSYIFQNNVQVLFGASSANAALLNDPRFTNINTPPLTNTAPPIARPFTPFLDTSGRPVGEQMGQFNYTVDPNFKTPYSYAFSFGVQRELPGNFMLEVEYVGRLGRKLFSQADAAQIVNFKDAASGQTLSAAFNALQAQLQANTPANSVTPQAWFENQLTTGIAALRGPGVNCTNVPNTGNRPNCTALVAALSGRLVTIGDLSDTIQGLNGNRLLLPSVGLSGQFAANLYNSSMASSNYNGLLVSLHKRLSRGLFFDVNYTFSHSIDNQSSVVNTVAGGLICDLRNLRVCRGNSDFDATHVISSIWTYELPFGKGRFLGGNAPGWIDRIIGGWEVSGIYTFRTGFAFGTTTGAFPVTFNFNSPAVLTGDISALAGNLHTAGSGGGASLQYFADPTAALAALRNPTGGEIGNRNILRGPGFWNVDMAVLKNIKMPWSESHTLQLRWESFNLFNHANFADPSANINSASTFGQITVQRNDSRQMQFALRYDF